MKYIYCPTCGSKLSLKAAGDEGDVPYCERCQRYWFDNFSDASIVLVANEYDEIALLRQGYMSDRYASFVSGYIKPGETAEQTAMREVEEEIGVKLLSLENCGTVWFGQHDLLMHAFIGRAKKRDFVLSSEVDSAQWVPAREVADKVFPDSPGNALYYLYKIYMSRYCNHDVI